MGDIVFKDMVAALAKDGQQIADEMTAEEAHLLHMAVGIAGEAGELLDAIKKHVIYKQPLDIANVIEELGDLKFYMQGIMNKLDLSDKLIEDANILKLSERYKGLQYSDQAAKERADKNEQ